MVDRSIVGMAQLAILLPAAPLLVITLANIIKMCQTSAANAWNSRMDMNGFVHGGIINITGGDGITINTTTDGASPEYPQIIATGTGTGLQYVSTDNTLTGDGTSTNPLHVVEQGGIKRIISSTPNVHIKTTEPIEGKTVYIAVDQGSTPGGDSYWMQQDTTPSTITLVSPATSISVPDRIECGSLTVNQQSFDDKANKFTLTIPTTHNLGSITVGTDISGLTLTLPTTWTHQQMSPPDAPQHGYSTVLTFNADSTCNFTITYADGNTDTGNDTMNFNKQGTITPLYQTSQWIAPIFTMPSDQSYIVSTIGSFWSGDPNATGITYITTTDVVMDLQQVYEAIGTDPIIDSIWYVDEKGSTCTTDSNTVVTVRHLEIVDESHLNGITTVSGNIAVLSTDPNSITTRGGIIATIPGSDIATSITRGGPEYVGPP
jgi:hypothetical protein